MTKRVIEISGFDACLKARNRQITIAREGEIVGQFPAEDVGLLIVDTFNSSFSNGTLIEMVEAGGLVVLCGKDHLPAAFVVPAEGNALQVQRMGQQLSLTLPRRKRLWQELVRRKVLNQAAVATDPALAEKLTRLAGRVGSGDPANVEAHAAREFWGAFLPAEKFRRDRDGPSPNHFLNYGYITLRAAMARAICGAGLNPAYGLHHTNRSSGFCLADDLMEPFRPFVDCAARALHLEGLRELDKKAKAVLIGVLHERCRCGKQSGSVETAMDRTVASLCHCFAGLRATLDLPELHR